MNILGLHTGHDASVALKLGDSYRVIELERIYSERYFSLRRSGVSADDVSKVVGNLFPDSDFDVGLVIHGNKDFEPIKWKSLRVGEWNRVDHHRAHAAASFYQSPFDEALIVSYDGGGNDGWFRSFVGKRPDTIEYLDCGLRLNLGSAYAALAIPIKEIRKNWKAPLANSGKLMGLAGYGTPQPQWRVPIRAFFTQSVAISRKRARLLPELGRQLGLDFAVADAICGGLAFDFAATCQAVFEDLVLETVIPMARRFDLPVCLSGGCALNVAVNERLARLISQPVFVPPNPSDCGLTLGAIFLHSPPQSEINVAYCGIPLLDENTLLDTVGRFQARKTSTDEVAGLLSEGKVVGVARGNSEHGPRALGNRSLLCDPGAAGIQERLNSRVKFREPFRPYAPVVRAGDAETYFDCLSYDMSYMSFNPRVREDWKDRLAGIVHVDGTARVQTVSQPKNSWLYELLGAFAQKKGYGVLLNTSFNIKGRPIISTVSEAIEILRTTDVDFAVVGDYLFDGEKVRMQCGEHCHPSSAKSVS